MTEKRPSPREVARAALNRLEFLADPVKARGAERYFKETVKCFGVAAPEIHALAAELHGLVKRTWTIDDDLIHKANGWLLREAGKTDPGRLERFLLAHGPAIPRTTLRYAIERFPEPKRKALLRDTRQR